jgi:hypothetical protein
LTAPPDTYLLYQIYFHHTFFSTIYNSFFCVKKTSDAERLTIPD